MTEQSTNKPKMRPGDGTPGPGRPKGIPNKNNKLLKDAIIEAAIIAGDKDGLVGYLVKQARQKNPTAFMGLLKQILPMQVTGAEGGPLRLIDLGRHLSRLSDEEIDALESAAAAIAAAEPDAEGDTGGEA